MTDDSDANASGWYPDPARVHHQRYWSGAAWTPRVADAFGVTAAHHLERAFAPPGGGVVMPTPVPPKPPTPSLSLVASAAAPVPPVPPGLPPPAAEEAAAVIVVADGARSAGWYADPSGIHCERSWDGTAWSAVVVDRNRALVEHGIRERYAPPDGEPSS